MVETYLILRRHLMQKFPRGRFSFYSPGISPYVDYVLPISQTSPDRIARTLLVVFPSAPQSRFS